jgi:hypothetical protein
MKSAIEAAHRVLRQKRTTLTSTKRADPTAATPQAVFVVVHEEHRIYSGNDFNIIGTYAKAEDANERVLDVFKRDHGVYLDCGDIVNEHVRDPLYIGENQVVWWIDEHSALSLTAKDGGDGDLYKVYTCRQELL